MPLNIDWQQILLHLLNFVILATGLSLLLFRPVRKFMNERRAHYEKQEEQISRDRAANEAMKAEYEEKLRQAEIEIREMRRAEEVRMAEQARLNAEKARETAAAILSEAEHDAELRKEHILESAQTEIGELVIFATQKLLSETAGEEHDSALYDAFVRISEKHGEDENA